MFFWVLLATPFTHGQSTEKALNSSLPAKWEIGIDVLPLIKMNHLPQNTLFFRRNYAVNDRTCKAFRFRVGVDAEDRYVITSFDDYLIADRRNYAPYLGIGHEWKFLYNKYRWYIATEISGQLLYGNNKYLSSHNGVPVRIDLKVRNQSITGNGILGLQYKIGNRLFISAESSVEINYRHEWSKGIGRNDQGTVVSNPGEDRVVFSSKFIPIFSLNLNYSLQKKAQKQPLGVK